MGLVVFWLFFLLVSALVCGAVAGSIADKRNASYGMYFALGFFFGVIGIIAAAFAGNGGRQVTVVNNYYAVNPDGSHSLMPSIPPSTRHAPVAAARRQLWGCTTPGCSAYHQPSRDAFCVVCRAQTHALPLARVQTRARADLDTRACENTDCVAVGERTPNLVCRACRRDTVMAWAAPAPGATPDPTPALAPATRFPATAVTAGSHGPAHLLTRRCTHWECPESTALTSNLVCRACRRDTAAVSVV